MPAKCLYTSGALKYTIGLFGFVLSTLVIVLNSASALSYPVGAMTMSSPAYQSTASMSVILVAPGSTVVYSSVQVGVLGTPCKSSIPFLTPMTLLP